MITPTFTTYRHQIIRWNGTNPQSAKYQLQVVALSQQGQALHRANWNFATLRGLMTFVEKNFPELDLLSQSVIQFQVLPRLREAV